MDTAPIFSYLHVIPCPKYPSTRGLIANIPTYYGSNPSPSTINRPTIRLNRNIPSSSRASAVNDISAIASDPAQAEITWQIVIGALGKYLVLLLLWSLGLSSARELYVAQRNCKVCKGSGLVLRDKKYYFRCPGCGMIPSTLVGFCHGNHGGDSLLV
ncbi:hypothetical protein Pfo_013501, partial [Paulownia fortunei]